MFVVIHEEGNCGCECDPYYYSILGIFNNKEDAELCFNKDEEKNKYLYNKSREGGEEGRKLYMHYNATIEEVQTSFEYNEETVYVIIDSYERDANFDSIIGIYKTEEEANRILKEKEKYMKEDIYAKYKEMGVEITDKNDLTNVELLYLYSFPVLNNNS